MRTPLVLLKFLLIWVFAAAAPAVFAHVFFPSRGVPFVVIGVGVLLLFFLLRANVILRKFLKPALFEVGSTKIFTIEDPSSHAFATQGVFAAEPTLWVTRGALSLLSPDEVENLVRGMTVAARQGGLRFETALTAALILLVKKVPPGLREIVFFKQKRTKTLFIRDSLQAVFWFAWILLLESLYFKGRKGAPLVAEEVLRKLEAESRRCVPRLPVALSSHSAVSPWPDAFLTLGRSCLLPKRAVNLRA